MRKMILKTWRLALTLFIIVAFSMTSPTYASYRLEVSPYDSQTVQLYFSDNNDALLLSDYPYALSAASDVTAFARSHGMDIRRDDSNIADEIMLHAYAWMIPISLAKQHANPMDLTMNSESWLRDIMEDALRRVVGVILD